MSPLPHCAVFRNWSRVALLYTGSRDGDGSGSATFHLQHLLLQKDIDCLTRKMPAIYKNVSNLQRIISIHIQGPLMQMDGITTKCTYKE